MIKSCIMEYMGKVGNWDPPGNKAPSLCVTLLVSRCELAVHYFSLPADYLESLQVAHHQCPESVAFGPRDVEDKTSSHQCVYS